MNDQSVPHVHARRGRRLEAAAEQVRVPPARVRRYIRAGLLHPTYVEGRAVYFDEIEMARLRKIRRLRDDLGLDLAAIEVVLRLLDEIDTLRTALRNASR